MVDTVAVIAGGLGIVSTGLEQGQRWVNGQRLYRPPGSNLGHRNLGERGWLRRRRRKSNQQRGDPLL